MNPHVLFHTVLTDKGIEFIGEERWPISKDRCKETSKLSRPFVHPKHVKYQLTTGNPIRTSYGTAYLLQVLK